MTDFILRDSRSPGMVLHPSTECALAALQDMQEQRFSKILDVGCGSGLLALAALELWPEAKILASDISEKAVADAKANLAGRAEALRADGLDHPRIRAQAPYDLIMCNLLAEIHIRTAPEVKSCLAPGGVAVLSGILTWKLPQVTEACAALGFEILEETQVHEWRAVVMARRSASDD